MNVAGHLSAESVRPSFWRQLDGGNNSLGQRRAAFWRRAAEESYLEGKFGEAYRESRARALRYGLF